MSPITPTTSQPSPDPSCATGGEDTSFSRLNFFHSVWSLGFVSLAGLAFNFLLARLLSIEDVGHIRVVRSVIEFACFPAGIGMSIAAGKFAADSRLPVVRRRSTLAVANQLTLGTSLIVTVMILVLSFWPAMLRDQVARTMLPWTVALIPLIALTRTQMSHLQGTNQILRLALTQALRCVVLLGSGVILIASLGIAGWIACMLVSELFACMLGVWMVGHGFLIRAPTEDVARLRAPMLRFGAYIAATQTLQAAFVSVDVLFLDRFHNDSVMIAQYGMATLVFSATMLVPQSFIQSHFSKIAAQSHDPARHWLHFLWFFPRAMAAIVVGATAGYFATPLIGWVFGEGYAMSGVILSWLIPAFVFQSAGLLAGSFVINAGLAREHMISMIIVGGGFIGLCMALIPRYGVAGACLSLSLAYALRAILSMVILMLYRRGILKGGTRFGDV